MCVHGKVAPPKPNPTTVAYRVVPPKIAVRNANFNWKNLIYLIYKIKLFPIIRRKSTKFLVVDQIYLLVETFADRAWTSWEKS